jgi:iron complex transport system ATP-binding protein
LLGAVSGDLPLSAGSVELDGAPITSWSASELAMRRAVLPQHAVVSFPFTVAQVVQMGRAPWSRTDRAADDEAEVAAALAATDVGAFVRRSFTALSGGEQARVMLSRVLAQRAQLLVLDEPTAALDLHHQEVVLATARERAATGDGVLVVLHDIGSAGVCADRVALLSEGRIVACGPPAEVLAPERLSEVYRHEVDVIPHPVTGELLVLPRRDWIGRRLVR